MRLLALLLVSLCGLGAQTITNYQAEEVGSNCASIRFDVSGLSGAVTFAIEGGPTTGLGFSRPSYSSDVNGTHWNPFCNAAANTDYYIKPTVDAVELLCPVVCTDCDETDDAMFPVGGSNLNCVGVGQPAYFHTAARPGSIAPAPPVHAVTDPYAEDDSPAGVTQTDCAGFDAAFAAAKTAGGVRVIEVDISGGPCVRDSLNLTGATNRVIIRPDVGAALLVSDFAQIAGDEPNVLHFRRSSGKLGEGLNVSFLTGGTNVTLQQVKIGDDPKPYAPTTVGVSSVTPGTRTLGLASACPTGLSLFDEVWLDMPAMDDYPATAQVSSCTGSTLVLATGTFDGTDATGASVTWGSNIPVSTCNQATPVECTTTVPHGLPTGSFTGQNWLHIGGVNNVPTGTYHFVVTGASTFTLTGTTGGAAYVASDYDFVYFNSALRWQLIDASGTTNFRCLHCILGTPWYGQYAARSVLALGSSTGAIVRDGIAYGAIPNCPLSPTTGLPACGAHGAYASNVFSADNGNDLQWVNQTVYDCAGICFDFQQNVGPPADVTVSQVHFRASERVFPDFLDGAIGAGFGLWGQMRHFLEWKGGCTRCLLEGVFFSGQAADLAQPQGYGVFINDTPNTTQTASPFPVRDVKIAWNVFERVAHCFAISSGAAPGVNNRTFHARVEITDNVCTQDWQTRRISPGSSGSTAKAGGSFSGGQLLLAAGGELINVSRNVWRTSQGSGGGWIFGYGSQWMPDILVEDNVFVWHGGNGSGFTSISTPFSPVNTTSYQTRFDSAAPGSSASWRGNLIVSGVENPAAIDTYKASTADGDTKTPAECAAAFGSTGTFTDVACVPGNSYQDRFDAVFPGGSLLPGGAYAGYGPSSLTTLLDKLGMTRGLGVTQSEAGGPVTFAWTCPSSSAGRVRLSGDGWATAAVETATGGSPAQSVIFTGLSAGATYAARVECPGGKTLDWTRELL